MIEKKEKIDTFLDEMRRQLAENHPEMELIEEKTPDGDESITVARKDTGFSTGSLDHIALLDNFEEEQPVRELAETAVQFFMDTFTGKDFSRENILDNTVINLVSTRQMEEKGDLTAEIPHIEIGDMSLIYETKVGNDAYQTLEARSLDKLGLTLEQIHEIAMKNSEEKYPAELVKIQNGEYRVRAKEGSVCPASAFLYKGVLKTLANRMGSDLLIMPMRGGCTAICSEDLYSPQELIKALAQINNDPELEEAGPIISKSIFYYDRKSQRLDAVAGYRDGPEVLQMLGELLEMAAPKSGEDGQDPEEEVRHD